MSSTGVMQDKLGQAPDAGRIFDERVRDGAASLLLAALAGFAIVRLFVLKRKARNMTAAAKA